MNRQFIPIFRYHNPKLDVEVDNKEDAVALELTFVDDSRKSVAEVRSFHDAAQIILDCDREKTLELLSSR
jgi:hypothetical protein